MKNTSAIVAFDLGTTRLKTGIFSDQGDCIEIVTSKTPYVGARENNEIDLSSFTDVIHSHLTKVQQVAAASGHCVSKVVINGQRSTVAFWSEQGPLAPAISWQDTRGAAVLDSILLATPSRHASIIEKTGLFPSAHFSASKIGWALKYWPKVGGALRKKTLQIGSLNSFLIWLLTEKKKHIIDATLAQRTLLFNINTMRWDRTLCQWFQIPTEVLPHISPTVGSLGKATLLNLNAEICVSIGDTQAAIIGQQFGSRYRTAIQFGTGAFIAMHPSKKRISIPRLLTSVLYHKKTTTGSWDSRYFLEGTVNAVSHWFKEPLPPQPDHKSMNIKESVLVPALKGLASPRWDHNAKSKLFVPLKGLKEEANVIIARAIAERLKDSIDWAHLAGFKTSTSAVTSGGVLRHKRFFQMMSANLQMDLKELSVQEAGLTGSVSLVVDRMRPVKVKRAVKPTIKKQKALQRAFEWDQCLRQERFGRMYSWFEGSVIADELRRGKTFLLGHRGASKRAPENSMAALSAVVDGGARGFEIDVRMSKDGVLVLSHDQSLKRCAGVNRNVDSLPWQELRNIDIGSDFNRKFKGETIPSLEQVLESFRNQVIMIEVKHESHQQGLWLKLGALIKKMNAKGRVLVCSFHTPEAVRFKQTFPSILTGGIIGRRHPEFDIQTDPYPTLDFLSIRSSRWRPQSTAVLRKLGRMSFVWTVDRQASLSRLTKYGVDGVISNMPAALSKKV